MSARRRATAKTATNPPTSGGYSVVGTRRRSEAPNVAGGDGRPERQRCACVRLPSFDFHMDAGFVKDSSASQTGRL